MAVTPFPVGIPADTSLNDVRSRTKALLKSVRAGEAAALDRIKPYFQDASSLTLQRAQLVMAREQGFSSWVNLKAFVETRDELADCQRELTGMPTSKQRAGTLRKYTARELRRLTRSVATSLGVAVDDADIACCTFCFTPQPRCGKFIAGTGCFICDQCVDRCINLMQQPPNSPSTRGDVPCSFCKKPASQVDHLVTASNGSICNECVDLCLEIVWPSPESPGEGE